MRGHVSRFVGRHPVRAVMAVAAVGVLVAGCVDESDVEDSDPTAASGSGPQSGPPSDDQRSHDPPLDIEPALPTIEDLPDGWEEVAAQEREPNSCLDRLTDPGGPFAPSASVHRAFAASDLGPFLLAVVGTDPAEESLVAADDVLVACDGGTTDAGFTTSIEATTLPDLPPGSLAVRATESHDAGGSVEVVVAAAGTESATALVLAATPLGDLDDATISQTLTTMVERLP